MAHLLKLLRLFIGISVLREVTSWSITLPKTVTAVEGSCVVVPCQTQPHSRVQWYQYHSLKYLVVYDGVHSHKIQQEFRSRTSVLGKASEGNCSLLITDVRAADNNLQLYVWVNPDSASTQKFYEQLVTLFVERKTPKISIQKQIADGEMFQVICSINHSCPFLTPSLHWNIPSPFLENRTQMAFTEKVQGQWLYTEIIYGVATYKMHNSTMKCSAKFRTYTKESQQITFNILYKPQTVTLMLENDLVKEGGSIIMECAANCNPQPHTYFWLKRQMGQTTKTDSTQKTMLFDSITRDTSVSCIAHNDIGAGQSDWLELDVQYAPVILPESSCRLTEKVLKCVCQADASPHALIYWNVDGNDTLLSSSRTVSTHEKHVVSGEMSGAALSQSNVSCTATNYLGSDTKQLNGGKTSSFSMWLPAAVVLGIASLLGCVLLIYKIFFRNRRPPGSVCNTTISLRPQGASFEQEQVYNPPPRPQHADTHSSPRQPENDSEADEPRDVYDNDFVVEMQANRAEQYRDNATAHRTEGEMEPLDEAADCDMSTYLNC